MDKQFIILLIGRIFQAVLGLASLKLMTKILNGEELGTIFLINSLSSYLSLLILNPIGLYLNKNYLSSKYNGTSKKLLNFYFINTFISVLLGTIIISIIKWKTNIVTSVSILNIFFLLFWGTLLNSWLSTCTTLINLGNERLKFITFNISSIALSLLASFLFTYFNQRIAEYWFLGQIVGQSIPFILAWVNLTKSNNKNTDTSIIETPISWKEILPFCLPLSLANIFMWIQNESFRFLIEKYLNLNTLAEIGIGLTLSLSIFTVLESLCHQFYLPIFYKEITMAGNDLGKRENAWARMFSSLTPAYIITTLFVVFLGPFIMRILADEKYISSYKYLILGGLIQFIRLQSSLFSLAGQGENKNKPLLYSYVVGAILTLAGVFIAIKLNLGVIYLVLTLILAATLSLFLLYWLLSKSFSFKFYIPGLWRILISSLPFLFAIFFWPLQKNLQLSLLVTSIFGLYFIFLQFTAYKGVKNG